MAKQHEHHVASGGKSAGCPRIVSVSVFAAILAAPFCAGAFNWSDYAAGAVAYYHQRGEPHVAAALDGLGYTVHSYQLFAEFALLLVALH